MITFTIHKKHVFLLTKDSGIGLQNLQELIKELNRTLNIKNNVSDETQTNIQIPLNA